MHGILHRIEGDFDNARAWYADVSKWDGFEKIWGASTAAAEDDGQKAPAQDNANDFLDRIEVCVRDGAQQNPPQDLEKASRDEIGKLLDWCVEKFGAEQDLDASKDWVQPSEEIARKGQDMVSGSAGHRTF